MYFIETFITLKMVKVLKHGASKKSILSTLKALEKSNNKGIDIKKYTGKIKFKEDALKIQKNLRDEWD